MVTMQISTEGKIGIGLALFGLLGGGAIVVFPDQTWIGWSMIAVALVGFMWLTLHHLKIGQWPMLAAGIGTMIFLGWLTWFLHSIGLTLPGQISMADGTTVQLGPRKRDKIPPAAIATSLNILFGPESVKPKEIQSHNIEWQAIEQVATGYNKKYSIINQLGTYDAQAFACLGNNNVYDEKCWEKYTYKKLELVLSFEKPITFKNIKIDKVQGGAVPKWNKVIMTETDAVLKFDYYPSDTLLNIEAVE
jgi:hypothetical protein